MTFDIIIAVIFAVFLIAGYKRGLVRSVYSLLSVAVSIALLYFCREFFVEYIVSSPVGKWIFNLFRENYGADVAQKCSYAATYIVSIIILYAIIRFIVKALFGLLDFIAKLPLINIVNSILGAVFGCVSGILWILIIVNILHCFPKTADFVADSSIVEYFNLLAVNFMK